MNQLPVNPLGGSVGCLPALLALLGFAVSAGAQRGPLAPWLFGAAGLFALSLAFRSSIDIHLCDGFPLGTHLLWHVLNGKLLGMLVIPVVRHGEPQRR